MTAEEILLDWAVSRAYDANYPYSVRAYAKAVLRSYLKRIFREVQPWTESSSLLSMPN